MRNNTFCKAIRCPFSDAFYLSETKLCLTKRDGGIPYGLCYYFENDREIRTVRPIGFTAEHFPYQSDMQIVAALAKSKYRKSRSSALKHFLIEKLFRR